TPRAPERTFLAGEYPGARALVRGCARPCGKRTEAHWDGGKLALTGLPPASGIVTLRGTHSPDSLAAPREALMQDADPQRPDDAPRFRSPKRALAHCFRISRDRWKLKATQRRQEVRALRVRLRDLLASRHLWKQKALHLQRQLEQLLGLAPQPDGP